MKKIINSRLSQCIMVLALAISGQNVIAAKAELQEDPAKNPLGCRDIGYQYVLNTLQIIPHTGEGKQSLYFVYNRLNKPINLYQMLPENSTLNTYLNHSISPQQWSVLATNQDILKYNCTVEDNKSSAYGKIVKCADSIKVCEFARVKFGLNNRGNFWLPGSNNRGGAVGDVTRYGIIAR